MVLEKIRDCWNKILDISRLGFLAPQVGDGTRMFMRGLKISANGLLYNDARPQTEPNTKNDYIKLFIIIFGLMALTYLVGVVTAAVQSDSFPKPFYQIWLQYDSNHYINIAKLGYGTSPDQRVLIVFFPLYPVLIKLLNFAVHGFFFNLLHYTYLDDYLVSALLIANISYAFAMLYLFKLVRLDYSKDVAFRTVFYISIFPTAYFMRAAYTESLFLALAIMSFYYARKNKWLVACILGCLLTATRITGVFIIPALALEYLQQRDWSFKKIDRRSWFLLIVPIGVITYFIINIVVNGNPFSFLPLEKEVWNKAIENPFKGFILALGWFGEWVKPEQQIIVAWGETGAGVLGFVLVLWLTLKYRPMYATFTSLSWILATATEFWLSIPRYTLSMFPIFIVFAKWGKNRAVDYLITFFFLSLFVIFMTHFTQARWSF